MSKKQYRDMPICKKSEFILCQVCRLDDTQTAFKVLVFWMEFGSIRALLTSELLHKHNNMHIISRA